LTDSVKFLLTQAGTGIQCLATKAPAVAIDTGGGGLAAVVSVYTCSSLTRGAGCLGIHQTNTEKDGYRELMLWKTHYRFCTKVQVWSVSANCRV